VFDNGNVADSQFGLMILPGGRAPVPGIRLDQPALVSAGGPPAPAPMWADGERQAMVQFLDGTWHLCRLTSWQSTGGGTWLCNLRWGVAGRIYQAAYVYDPAKVQRR
jgi:hypothetical protein